MVTRIAAVVREAVADTRASFLPVVESVAPGVGGVDGVGAVTTGTAVIRRGVGRAERAGIIAHKTVAVVHVAVLAAIIGHAIRWCLKPNALVVSPHGERILMSCPDLAGVITRLLSCFCGIAFAERVRRRQDGVNGAVPTVPAAR